MAKSLDRVNYFILLKASEVLLRPKDLDQLSKRSI